MDPNNKLVMKKEELDRDTRRRNKSKDLLDTRPTKKAICSMKVQIASRDPCSTYTDDDSISIDQKDKENRNMRSMFQPSKPIPKSYQIRS